MREVKNREQLITLHGAEAVKMAEAIELFLTVSGHMGLVGEMLRHEEVLHHLDVIYAMLKEVHETFQPLGEVVDKVRVAMEKAESARGH